MTPCSKFSLKFTTKFSVKNVHIITYLNKAVYTLIIEQISNVLNIREYLFCPR
jgi:hypothetical protein